MIDLPSPPSETVVPIERFDVNASLKAYPSINDFFERYPQMEKIFASFGPDEERALLTLVVTGQGELLCKGYVQHTNSHEQLTQLARQLDEIEKFYAPIGGILGYQTLFLKLVKDSQKYNDEGFVYSKPEGKNLAEETAETRELTLEALRNLERTALILPIGGAGDRLNLKHQETGQCLPAACLQFCGYNLLEGIMRDLQAQEYLHFKLFGSQAKSPIVLMTSLEKNNHQHIVDICAKNQWFSRSPDRFFFILQPAAPLLTAEGKWVFSKPLELLMKPSGHGVLWKLMADSGIFEKLEAEGIHKAVIRQINNPLAATDYGLLAFTGLGWKGHYAFGFASSKRQINIPAGVLVLKEKTTSEGYESILTNIEYTDFKRYGIQDIPETPESNFSKYSLNTNILFADLKAVRHAVQRRPFPGLLINIKSKFPCLDEKGNTSLANAGRIETTMQNIADELSFKGIEKPSSDKLPAYITYNTLQKTFSAIKKQYVLGEPTEGTPENAYYDLLSNEGDLLRSHCQITMPELGTLDACLANKPGYLVRYHPALGPCFSIIGQKIQHGALAEESELVLNIAELEWKNVTLDGSLVICATDPMGLENPQKNYSHAGGKCELRNIRVLNAGIDRKGENPVWMGNPSRKEVLEITIEGSGEFFAENITFKGQHRFFVPSGTRLTVFEEKGQLKTVSKNIAAPTWHWEYSVGKSNRIIMNKKAT